MESRTEVLVFNLKNYHQILDKKIKLRIKIKDLKVRLKLKFGALRLRLSAEPDKLEPVEHCIWCIAYSFFISFFISFLLSK
jgi:hypothetical protein